MDSQASNNSDINISDVLEVIKMDCKHMEVTRTNSNVEGAYIRIVEQPASKALRFRYECEGRSAGSIPGVRSTQENKSYPTIQIVGYKGKAVVVVSCVTKDSPYKVHPHNLVGRDGCKKGVCTVEVQNDSMMMSFDHLGIQCVKKKDIEEALKLREEIRVDPFRQKFAHKSQPGSIDLNAVRLCFQAFLADENGKFKHVLNPVVSDVIYDKKALCDLNICKLSHSSASVIGGLEMILLCEKVAKEDISVRFFETDLNGHLLWEALGDFSPTQVHKQVAITFKTPKYRIIDVDKPVQVYIQLRRPSDGETSEPLPFHLTPLDSVYPGERSSSRKRQRVSSRDSESLQVPHLSPRPVLHVKLEPVDGSPQPYYNRNSPFHRTPSPEYNSNLPQVSPHHDTYQQQVYQPPASTLPPTYHLDPTLHLQTTTTQPSGYLLNNHLGAMNQQVLSQHYPQYNVAGSSHISLQPTQMMDNGNFETQLLDISRNIPSETLDDNLAMINPSNLRDLANISRDLSNVSIGCVDQPTSTPSQENMSISLTKIVDSAYEKFRDETDSVSDEGAS